MKRDKTVLLKIVKYCDDINFLIKKFNNDFVNYTNDISFQYSCNMCIVQIGELMLWLSEDFRQDHKEIPCFEEGIHPCIPRQRPAGCGCWPYAGA